MKSASQAISDTDIKRVGKSGQISLGKQLTGQYFREEHQPDGSIVLVPVVVVPRSHWTVRDEGKIRKALAWAAEHPARASDVDQLVEKAKTPAARKRRGR
ncbi:MAG: hypothetical protein OK454_07460 [Thaumarchaeota archaeon]|jgi:hypothetical protein|nr:hypothetical protein [Nitrososphaerota archaeon]